MVSQPGRLGRRAAPLLQRFAGRRVQLAALGGGQAVIEYLADQRVPEPVPRRAGMVNVEQQSRCSLIQQLGGGFLADPADALQQIVLDRFRRGFRYDRRRGQ